MATASTHGDRAVARQPAASGGTCVLCGGSTSVESSRMERLARLPFAFAAATLGIILAQPLGTALQARVTTQADVGDLHIVSVTQERRAGILVHTVRTEG